MLTHWLLDFVIPIELIQGTPGSCRQWVNKILIHLHIHNNDNLSSTFPTIIIHNEKYSGVFQNDDLKRVFNSKGNTGNSLLRKNTAQFVPLGWKFWFPVWRLESRLQPLTPSSRIPWRHPPWCHHNATGFSEKRESRVEDAFSKYMLNYRISCNKIYNKMK